MGIGFNAMLGLQKGLSAKLMGEPTRGYNRKRRNPGPSGKAVEIASSKKTVCLIDTRHQRRCDKVIEVGRAHTRSNHKLGRIKG